MKYIVSALVCVLLFQLSISFSNSQVMDSDYVRQSETQGEVLGEEIDIVQEEVVEESEIVTEEDDTFVQDRVIELMAIAGGVILVFLFAYIVYGNKVKN